MEQNMTLKERIPKIQEQIIEAFANDYISNEAIFHFVRSKVECNYLECWASIVIVLGDLDTDPTLH